MNRGQIAFIDDEPQICAAARDWLEASGFAVNAHADPARALAQLDPAACDCLVTDLRMPGLDGRAVLQRVRALAPELPVVLLSGHADVQRAVEVMREGAFDFLEKPYGAEQLVEVLDRAVAHRRLQSQARAARPGEATGTLLETRLPGVSPVILGLRALVRQLADQPVDVLLRGAPGTGKAPLARALHDLGRRARRPFLSVDCAPRGGAGLAGSLEAELFGHERGIAPGSTGQRIGKLEQAQGGTVHLEGIEALDAGLQARLLRLLRERSIERIGSNAPRPVDVRIIASVTEPLGPRVAAGAFRAELMHRLATVELVLPPLAERREDIPVLYLGFLAEAAERFGLARPEVLPSDLAALALRPLPGNATELRALAERQVLGLATLAGGSGGEAAESLPARLARIEAETIAEALRLSEGRAGEAAARLGLPRRTLNEKIARHGLRGAE